MDNFSDKFFYHIYPIGMCGVPARNDFACPAGNGLRRTTITTTGSIDEFDIDGIRLDAANVMSVDFMRELSRRCKARKPRFWLMGETVAGDYRTLAHEGCLDSVTNYELYKGLWSSFKILRDWTPGTNGSGTSFPKSSEGYSLTAAAPSASWA